MLDKNSKISVLRTMIGLGEEIEPQFIVPQNSISNIRHKLGLSDRIIPAPCSVNSTTMPAVMPKENTIRSVQPTKTNIKCPHCENMAKNFLYLESLIRTNYSPKTQCGVCYSSLKYLQHVNKNIMQVFGNFDSIVEAAKAFSATQRQNPLIDTPITTRSRASISRTRKSRSTMKVKNSITRKASRKSISKGRLSKARSKVSKLHLAGKRSKHGPMSSKSANALRLTGGKTENKPQKQRQRTTKKVKKIKSEQNTQKALRKKAIKIIINGLKQQQHKITKNKRPKVSSATANKKTQRRVIKQNKSITM